MNKSKVRRFFDPTPKELGMQDSTYDEILIGMKVGKIDEDKLPKRFSVLVRKIIEKETQILKSHKDAA